MKKIIACFIIVFIHLLSIFILCYMPFVQMNQIDTWKETGEQVEGHWEVYKNGLPLMDENKNPITYPSNSQVGTKGFKYGF